MFGKHHKELEELNDYLTRILSGETTLPPLENKEGELSILRSNIYKAVSRLINVKDYEKESKINLANSLADISHQLKTPLTSITVMNDLLRDETDEKKRQEFIEIQSAQIEKMNWLVQNLLKISRIDAGSVTLKQEKISLKELVDLSLEPLLVLLELGLLFFLLHHNLYFLIILFILLHFYFCHILHILHMKLMKSKQ